MKVSQLKVNRLDSESPVRGGASEALTLDIRNEMCDYFGTPR